MSCGNSISISRLLKGHHSASLYLKACECVFRYHSSEIALSKRAAAREAPDCALTRMSTSTASDGPTNDYHTERDFHMLRSRQWERKRRRKLKLKGSERRAKGREELLAVWSLCEVDDQKPEACFEEAPLGV